MKYGFIFIFIFFNYIALAQKDSLVLEGKYYETNVYIYNPKLDDKFSIYEIVVNKDTIREELNSNAVEVDFQLLGLDLEDAVHMVILFDSMHPPLVINPEALYSPQRFKFSKPRIRKDVMSWRVYGDVSDYPIEIQQYKWNVWRTVSEVDPLDTVENNYYSAQIVPHSGVNKFRLKTININDEVVFSKEINYRSPYIKPVVIRNYKPENELEFSAETEYEIYNLKGEKVKSGLERYVDVSGLEPGEYWVNYDNQTEKIKKKK